MSRQNVFRVTWDDCQWDYSRSSGKGGQNVNKRDTKVRCAHAPSGAVGMSQEHREQRRNRVDAFQKMAASPEFQRWARIEASRRLGRARDVEGAVEAAMRQENIIVEGKKDGRWVPIEETAEPETV